VIILRSKSDLLRGSTTSRVSEIALEIDVSALTGAGLPELRSIMLDRVYQGIRADEDMPIVTRARHVACLDRAAADVAAFAEARARGLPAEIAGTHVHDATLALEELLGAVTTEDVLDAVFNSFCVGK